MRTDKEKYGLRGPVKSVHIETAQLEEQDGQIVEKRFFSYDVTFNKDGRLIEQISRNPDGSEWRIVNDYSDSGNLLATRSLDHAGTLHSEVRYTYDAEDRLAAEQHVTRDDRVTMHATYVYDDAGRKVKIQELDFPEDASMMIGLEGISPTVSAAAAKRVESRYDDRGEVVEVKVFNDEGAIITRVEVTRDARGNPLEETQYVEGAFQLGSPSDSCSAEAMAELSEEQKAEFAAEVARLFSPGSVMSNQTRRYDTEGRLIESKLTMMGMEANHQTYVNDEFGNSSEEVTYNENGMLAGKTLFAREYDQHGNWTKELGSKASAWDAEFELATPAHVTRRVITYW